MYSWPMQPSTMELFTKKVSKINIKLLTILAIFSINLGWGVILPPVDFPLITQKQ